MSGAILEGRQCLVCKTVFDAVSPGQWWCGPACCSKIQTRIAEKARERADLAAELSPPDAVSEAEKARMALSGPPEMGPDLFGERMDMVATLASLSARITDPDDRLVLLALADGYLSRARGSLLDVQEDRGEAEAWEDPPGDGEDVRDPDGVPVGPGRDAGGEEEAGDGR